MRGNSAAAAACFLAILLGLTLAFYPANKAAYAHIFKGNENVAFLAMVQQIKIETSLAGNNTSNKVIADQHVGKAIETLSNATLKEIEERNKRIATDLPAAIKQLKTSIDADKTSAGNISEQMQGVSDLLDEAVQVRTDPAQVSNSTIQALVVASLTNLALENYGKAVGFQGNMTDMSSMASSQEQGMSSMQYATNNSSNNMQMSGNAVAIAKIVSEANYQSALALAEKAQELYQQQIKTKAIPGTENAVKALDSAFPAFVKAISDKASPMDVMSVAHLRVHPNLMLAFNLQATA